MKVAGSQNTSTAKDKNSLLYHDLKKKLSLDMASSANVTAGNDIVVAPSTWRKDIIKDNNLLNLTG